MNLHQQDLFKGGAVHEVLADRWPVILLSGLSTATVEQLRQKYPTPNNCVALAAPKLNAEILASANQATIQRDNRLVVIQHQVGAALSAVGKALSELLQNSDADDSKTSDRAVK